MIKEELKYIKTENGYKVSMPLITNEELDYIDFNFYSIVDEYIKRLNDKKDKTIEQRLIYDLQQDNKQLKEQLEYLRSGEYYNQLRFENEMLQQVVDTNGVPSEVYDYIDCTHRNTELLEENEKLKQKIKEHIKRENKLIIKLIGSDEINGKENN